MPWFSWSFGFGIRKEDGEAGRRKYRQKPHLNEIMVTTVQFQMGSPEPLLTIGPK